MSIKGIPVSTPMLRPDWNQTDPRRSDYIRNKPDLSAQMNELMGDKMDEFLNEKADDLNARVDELVSEKMDELSDRIAEQVGAATAPRSAAGSVISVNDSIAAQLRGLKLYGKTTQDGTPTPENPVELVSAGNGGVINTTVCGGNLLDCEKMTSDGIEKLVDSNGYVTFTNNKTWNMYPAYNIEGFTGTLYTNIEIVSISGRAGVYAANSSDDYSTYANSVGKKNIAKKVDGFFRLMVAIDPGASVTFRASVSVNADAVYEPYKPAQTLTVSTPGGLPGIPVTSGGNYTDENGQQWICDEIDFTRGVYGRRIGIAVYDGSDDEEWQVLTTRSGSKRFLIQIPTSKPVDSTKAANLLNSQFLSVSADSIYADDTLGCAINQKSSLSVHTPQIQTLDAFKAHLANKPMTVAYELATFIETPLSAEELAQYSALHTNKPNTTVYNDAGAYMDVEYFSTNAAVPMTYTPEDEGKVLTINENGCVVPKKNSGGDSVKHTKSQTDIVAGSTSLEAGEIYMVYE